MVEASIQINGRWGLNGHESARLAVSAARFASDIVCMANGRSVNGKDVMSVMSLRVRRGTLVRILITGPDEIAALEALSAVLHAQVSS
ncbi:HPr family phosphocarrier protein [Paraburkholderia xenovorans]|uniref:Phosphocarrier HPr protein n=1 Tax=Paraburkholderia xenovorans (strain LB400) TaxID=266265 RepID=Q13JX6_PARXL|nr:HPr family phosphocarrier protein [Paraburkholderia xenovorans]ABE35613.1 Phosphocarrier HPr protein [Paraburkholderia xenovorans LB400]NPT34865.1 HPr family phosphocarrier protein [Paraburkholderia xenovorans]